MQSDTQQARRLAWEAFSVSLHQVYGPSQRQLDATPEACGQLRMQTVGPFDAARISLSSMRLRRRDMQRWEEYAFILLFHSGHARVSHGRHHEEVSAHDVVVTDSRGSFEFVVDEHCELTAFHVRRHLLSSIGPDGFGRAIRGGQGIGMLLSRLLGSLLEAEDALDDDDCVFVSDSLARMVDRCLTGSRQEDSNMRQRLARLRAWTLAHLDEPSLGPDALADVYGTSRRQLYRLFEECGTTPAIWLRDLRLEQARLRLTMPATEVRSITEIAFSVGFSDAAHFSRAFRQRYGASPSAVRISSAPPARLGSHLHHATC